MSCKYNNSLYTTIPEESIEYTEEIFDYHYAVDPTPTDYELEQEYMEIYEVIL